MQRTKQKVAALAMVCLFAWAPTAWAVGAPEVPNLLAHVWDFGAQIFEAVVEAFEVAGGYVPWGFDDARPPQEVGGVVDPFGIAPEADQSDLMGVIVPCG